MSLGNKTRDGHDKESLNVHAVLQQPSEPPPALLLIGDLTRDKQRIQHIPIGSFKHDPGGNVPQLREAVVAFTGRQVLPLLGRDISLTDWEAREDARMSVCSRMEDHVLYRCETPEPLVETFQRATGGHLFVGSRDAGRDRHLQLALAYDERRVYYFPNWSDGQKALFCAMLAITHHAPDVLLLDEIENHFHPDFITQLAILIKNTVPQSLVVTHHPHVLFTELVDKLYYIERGASIGEIPPRTLVVEKGFRPRSPRRHIRSLETDFETITAAYGLFHSQDRQLLNLAQLTLDAAEVALTAQVLALFEEHQEATAAEAGTGPVPDTQSRQLSTVLRRVAGTKRGPLKILDFGAGRGRAILEIHKQSQAQRHFDGEWVLWEPNPESRAELRGLGERCASPIRVANSVEDVGTGYDLVIVSNVLHELTPGKVEEALQMAFSALAPNDGALLISELYPLIRPERYAVAYEREQLETILSSLGCLVDSGTLNVRGGHVQSYWLLGRGGDRDEIMRTDAIRTRVEEVWSSTLERVARRYAARGPISSLREQIDALDLLTTAMSIIGYQKGVWK